MRSLSVVVLAALVLASPAAAADLELGKKVYTSKCANCHGANGEGNPKMAEMLKTKIAPLKASASKPEAEVRKVITEGKKPMPGYGKSLSQDELEAVIAYSNQLAGK